MMIRTRLVTALVFALAIVAAGCANEKSPPPPQPQKTAPQAAKKKAAPRQRLKVFTGTIVAVDQDAGTVTLRGPKSEMEFQVDEKAKKQLDGLRLGDKLIVKHVDEMALSIVKLRASSSALALKEKKVSWVWTAPGGESNAYRLGAAGYHGRSGKQPQA